jgi:hypothetical protein
MKQVKKVRKMYLCEITRDQKDKLCRLNQLLKNANPEYHYDAHSETDNIVRDWSWDSYGEAMETFKLVCLQILRKNNHGHLSHRLKNSKKIPNIHFCEALARKFHQHADLVQ